jgi:lipoate-protein ligase A
MSDRTVALIRRGFDDRAGFDTGVSHALLEQVSRGEIGETFRISIAGRSLAFGKRDVHSPGFAKAVRLAALHGYSPVIRLPGGRAVAFHERTISFSWTVPCADPVGSIRRRFTETAALIAHALGRVGVPSRIGEIPGEYCPGEYSINHAGTVKLAGIGQRLTSGASHVGGVLVVGDAASVRDVLIPVYDALGLTMDPRTIGAAADVAADVDADAIIAAIVEVLSEEHASIVPAVVDATTLARADDLAPLHVPEPAALASS